MKLVSSETSMVVAGAWNAAIVTPEWIQKYGLRQEPNEENRVQVFIPAGSGMVFEFPRFSFNGLVLAARPDALVINPKESSQAKMEEIEFLARNTLAELTHTPVNGIGHNFEFRDSSPDPRHLGVFTGSQEDLMDAAPNGWEVVGSNVTTSLRDGDTIVNIARLFDGTKLTVKFNFHHQIANRDQAMAVLSGDNGYKRLFQNYTIARELVAKMYGEIDDN